MATKPALTQTCPVCESDVIDMYGHLVHDEKCPLAFENVAIKPRKEAATGKVKSDGGSSSYYFLPEGAKDLNDLIEAKEMSFARGNIFKALYRLGEKEGVDVSYDLNKIEVFLDRLRKLNAAGRRL